MIGPDATRPLSVDAARARTLLGLLGSARFQALLDVFSERLALIAAKLDDVPDSIPELRTLVHKSCGSAGTLGLNEIMSRLQAIELRLPPPPGSGDEPPELIDDLRREVAQLADLLHEQRRAMLDPAYVAVRSSGTMLS